MTDKTHGISQVTVSHWTQIPAEFFDEFVAELSADGVPTSTEPRQDSGIYAGIELYIPTIVVVFISKSYFDGFLGEMGKDHYLALKYALGKLGSKIAPIKASLFGSKGKISAKNPYSFAYSIMAEAGNKCTFKFLVQNSLTDSQRTEAIGAFLEFANSFYSGTIDDVTMRELNSAGKNGRMLLIAYNFESRRIEPVDPFPDRLSTANNHSKSVL